MPEVLSRTSYAVKFELALTPEGDRLDVLATLVDSCESEHYPVDPPDPIEAIKFRMEQQGLTRRDLEAMLGARARRGGLEPDARSLNRRDPAIARSAWDHRRGANSPDSKECRLRRRSQATRASLTPARPSQICRSGGNRMLTARASLWPRSGPLPPPRGTGLAPC